MRVLFLVIGRMGSKGVPGKNIREVGGLPLIAYKILSARKSTFCSRLIVSTENSEISEIARRYGAETPFVRPTELASDTASSMDVVEHAMGWVEENTSELYDALMLLEPSSPFATSMDYDNAINLMIKKDASVVVGIKEAEVSSCFVGPVDPEGRITTIVDSIKKLDSHRRQDVEKEFTMNGAFYLARWEFLRKYRSFYFDRERTYGLPMDSFHSIEIDEVIDFRWAEFLVNKGYIDISHWKKADGICEQ